MTDFPQTTERFVFRPIDGSQPNDTWLLVRWRNPTTKTWMLPIVAKGPRAWVPGSGWSDGLTTTWEPTHWCEIPPVEGDEP